MNNLREFIQELRNNYDNSYWWADHQALRALVIGVIAGSVSLIFVYLECRVKRKVLDGVGG